MSHYLKNKKTTYPTRPNSVPHSPFWKTDSSSASPEISYILQTMKVYYHNSKSLPFVTTLHQINLVHTQK